MKPHFLVLQGADFLADHVEHEAKAVLGAAGTVEVVNLYRVAEAERRAAFAASAAAATAVVISAWTDGGLRQISPACWDDGPGVRVLSGTFDNRVEQNFGVPLAELRGRGIRVVDTSRSMTPTVAEYSLAMMLNSLRDIPNEIATVRRGDWRRDWTDRRGFIGTDLTGKRVGLAGFGVIGRRLTDLLVPFRCDIRAYDPFVSDADLAAAGVGRAGSLVSLAAGCELFVVAIPPTPATIGIIDAAVIDALPAGSHFILPTRMAVVEQAALWARVERGDLRVAVDVFDPEPPPPDAPFRTHPNVLPTPHIAGNTVFCHERCFSVACHEAVALVEGRPSPYEMSERDAALYAGRAEPPVGPGR